MYAYWWLRVLSIQQTSSLASLRLASTIPHSTLHYFNTDCRTNALSSTLHFKHPHRLLVHALKSWSHVWDVKCLMRWVNTSFALLLSLQSNASNVYTFYQSHWSCIAQYLNTSCQIHFPLHNPVMRCADSPFRHLLCSFELHSLIKKPTQHVVR